MIRFMKSLHQHFLATLLIAYPPTAWGPRLDEGLTNATTGVIPGALVLTTSSLSDDTEGLKLCCVLVNVRAGYV